MTLIAPHSTEYMAETPTALCSDCPPEGYPTDKTRCAPCPRASKSAHATTAIGIAAALMNVPRVEQTVHVETTIFSGSPLGPRYVVFVKPKNGAGEVYECGQRALDQLRMGVSPEELSLEPFEPEPEDDAEGIPSPESLRRWYEGRVL